MRLVVPETATAERFGPVTVAPDDARYGELVGRGINGRFAARPDSIAVAGSADQVVQVVQHAVDANHRIAVRSGGHCFEGFVDDPAVRVIIDLSELRSVGYDPAMRAFAAEPGATLGQMYRTLYLGWGVAVPAGRCPGIGVGGHICGGGGGALSQQYGLSVDHLYAVEVVVVDADGQARLVVATREPDDPNRDLWWGLTGAGGGNFGVITKYWFRELPQPPATVHKMSAAWMWGTLTQETFCRLVSNYGRWHAENSSVDSSLALLRPAAQVIGLDASVHGPDADSILDDYLAALADGVGEPAHHERKTVSWLTDTLTEDDEYAGVHSRFKSKAAFLRQPWSAEQVATVYRYLTDESYENPAAVAYLLSYGGRINDVPPDATAMVHRDSIMKAYWSVAWSDPAENDTHLTWLRRFYRDVYASTGGVPEASFINYPDVDLADPQWNTSGVPWSTLYFGDNYARLQEVKRRWDPRDIFRHALSIRP